MAQVKSRILCLMRSSDKHMAPQIHSNFQKIVVPVFIILALIGSNIKLAGAQTAQFNIIINAYVRASKAGKRTKKWDTKRVPTTATPASETIAEAPDYTPPSGNSTMFDRLGNVKGEDLKARLDNWAIELQQDPSSMGYIVVYSIPVGKRNYGQMLADKAKAYLINARGIDPGRLVTVDAGPRKDLTVELWTIRPGGD